MRLSHVTLQVSDIARSRAFYLGLGFKPIVLEDHYCRFLTSGDATVSIERHEGVINSGVEIGIEFETAAALDSYVVGLAANTNQFAHPLKDQSWLWREARVRDPDGHTLLLFFAGEAKLDPPWKVRA